MRYTSGGVRVSDQIHPASVVLFSVLLDRKPVEHPGFSHFSLNMQREARCPFPIFQASGNPQKKERCENPSLYFPRVRVPFHACHAMLVKREDAVDRFFMVEVGGNIPPKNISHVSRISSFECGDNSSSIFIVLKIIMV